MGHIGSSYTKKGEKDEIKRITTIITLNFTINSCLCNTAVARHRGRACIDMDVIVVQAALAYKLTKTMAGNCLIHHRKKNVILKSSSFY